MTRVTMIRREPAVDIIRAQKTSADTSSNSYTGLHGLGTLAKMKIDAVKKPCDVARWSRGYMYIVYLL